MNDQFYINVYLYFWERKLNKSTTLIVGEKIFRECCKKHLLYNGWFYRENGRKYPERLGIYEFLVL